MQRSLLNQVKPSLFILGLLFSLTTFYCLVAIAFEPDLGGVLGFLN